ncbi:SLAP domain-containing protein [Companilactobacillus jidongensis]|uniref:SLAP domain-containing protein n=1 Tax=Companilactobacillus jidongensis TaxID=2486006 RepID=UPI000F798721|nr:SLAP domain-containing protein [Companilactobacillus jidongensis]
MSKKKIILVATGLSAGMLLTSTVVNMPVISNLSQVQTVMASQSAWMPDGNLRGVIGGKLGNEDFTQEDLGNLSGILDLKGFNIKSLKGLEYAKNVKTLFATGNSITNFDELSKMKSLEKIFYDSKVTINEENVIPNNDSISIDLNHYIGENSLIGGLTGKFTVKLNGKEVQSKFMGNRILTISDLMANSEYQPFSSGDYSGKIEVSFQHMFNINNLILSGDQSVTINQPYSFTVQDPKINFKDNAQDNSVEVEFNSKWDPYSLIESVTDKYGEIIDKNEYESRITTDWNDENTEKEGEEFQVTYSIDGHDFPITVVVGKNPDENSGGGNGGGGNNGSDDSNIQVIDPTNIMTDEKSLPIYDENGKSIGNKSLTKETTDFVTKQENTVGDTKYYGIGDNEWVKATDVKIFQYNSSIKQTHGGDYKEIVKFRNSGVEKNRALKATSNWSTDRYALFQGEKYHRVATHEWVRDSDVVKYASVSGTLKINESSVLYNSQGKTGNRGLKVGSEFVTDKSATINGELMYRVATDEWIPASAVTLK